MVVYAGRLFLIHACIRNNNRTLEHTFEQMNPGFCRDQLKPGVMGVLKKTAGFYKKELEVKPVDNVAETVDDVGISVMKMGEDSTKEVEEE